MSELDEALGGLRDESTLVRLRAARKIGKTGRAEQIPQLRAIRAKERDSWVRSALDSSIRQLTLGGAIEEFGQGWISPPADESTEDIQALAIQNVAQIIIHEVRGILRTLASAAERETSSYDESDTAREVGRLSSFLETVERMQTASSPPKVVDFDLRDLILRTIRESGYTERDVAVFRNEPTVVQGDPDLLQLALKNVICNAVEASSESSKRVAVNFGANDVHTWVVVLDEGPGLPGSLTKAWEPGVTSKSKKEGHFGWGLPIAQRAVHSFRGSISLTPRETGGAAAEIRWPAPSQDRTGAT